MLSQYDYSTTVYLCIDRTGDSREMTEADRLKIKAAIASGDYAFDVDAATSPNYAMLGNEEINLMPDVTFDEPRLVKESSATGMEVAVTFHFRVESDVEDEDVVDEVVSDCMFFEIDGYETAEYC